MGKQRTTSAAPNIFAELGFDELEAENLKIRAELMLKIRRIIRDRELTQTAAAELFGTSQPRISHVVGGKIDEFTIDSLVNMLSSAGVRLRLEEESGALR